MVQLFPTIFSALILLTWPSYLTGASITLEDKLQQLTENYKLMEDKMKQMESKNNQLETQLTQLQDECTTKLTQLESKVQEQEKNLIDLRGPTALKSFQTSINNDETYIQSRAMPTSCEDLRLIGHIWSGLYSIMGTNMVQTVYCDFTKITSDPNFQQLIGSVDIKSVSVYFYVQRLTDGFTQTNTPVIFDQVRLNAGGAYSATTGRFTAPAGGIYFFSFTGLVKFPGYSSLVRTDIGLYKNGAFIGFSESDENFNSGFQYETISLQSTLELIKGDQIWIGISSISSGVSLEGNYYTHFNGFLLEQSSVF